MRPELAAIEAEYAPTRERYAALQSLLTPMPMPSTALALATPRDDFETYKAIQAENWTGLKHLRDSPLHYQYHKSAVDKDTPARLLGRAGHTLTLEPDKFARDYAVYEGDGSIASVDYKAFARANPGRQIVKAKGVAAARAIADAVRAHPVARRLLEGCSFEQTVTWVDPVTGILCKARMDMFNKDALFLGDLKTSNNVNKRRFGSLAARMGYQSQLGGHYFNGCKYGLGWEPEKVSIVAVESVAPYDVAVFTLSPKDIEAGQKEVAELLERLAECRATNKWPGQYPEETELELAGWVFNGTNEEITYDEVTE